MKYLLFETGEYYQRYKRWFAKDDIAALLDNSKDKQGTYIDGVKVYSPQEGIFFNAVCGCSGLQGSERHIKALSLKSSKLVVNSA